MNEAIKLAIEKGWYDDRSDYSIISVNYPKHRVFLDPLFWQALGKALGWKLDDGTILHSPEWKNAMHRFIDWIAEGKDTDLFFKKLLK